MDDRPAVDPRLLERTLALALEFLESLPDRPVRATASDQELRAALDVPLPEDGLDPETVIEDLARGVDAGLVASAGPRYFGFVIGGSVPAALAADWLTSAWDQNGGGHPASPGAMAVEEVARKWLLDVLRLPRDAGVGFTTGAQMGHFTALAAARHAVLARAGWDVERKGLQGAPRVRVLLGEHAHVTVPLALRMLGLGDATAQRIPADDQGRMLVEPLAKALAAERAPTIVCTQAGEIHTGAFDPIGEIATLCRKRGAWCHVDGAFGLWAAASPAHRHLVAGLDLAHSWTTDGHKWLNVPYDSGMAIVADAESHHAAMTSTSAYIPPAQEGQRYAYDWVPEFSRRARAFPVYAALRSLGRRGAADLVDRCCRHARLAAELLAAQEGVEVVHDVVLNQVSLRFADDDATTQAVVARVQEDGTCWMSGSTFRGQAVMRLSFSSWATTDVDVERSAAAILAAFAAERTGEPSGATPR